ncbi:MAG: ATP-binding protein, partial [Thermoanaerobaculia bacterium]
QVFTNLIGNAVKFTPDGGRITLEAEPGKGEIRFTVSDTGPGIPAEQMAHIFDRFWRVKQPHRQGTGLGLSIAKGIIDAHEGRLWVETRVGVGSRFHFTLPLHEPSP